MKKTNIVIISLCLSVLILTSVVHADVITPGASSIATLILIIIAAIIGIIALIQYFTNWIEKSSSFIPISKYFSVKCLKS
jgi:hypothetical protein